VQCRGNQEKSGMISLNNRRAPAEGRPSFLQGKGHRLRNQRKRERELSTDGKKGDISAHLQKRKGESCLGQREGKGLIFLKKKTTTASRYPAKKKRRGGTLGSGYQAGPVAGKAASTGTFAPAMGSVLLNRLHPKKKYSRCAAFGKSEEYPHHGQRAEKKERM